MGETHLLGPLQWGLDVGVLLRLRGWVMMHHMWRVELLLLLLIPVGAVSTAAAPHDRPWISLLACDLSMHLNLYLGLCDITARLDAVMHLSAAATAS